MFSERTCCCHRKVLLVMKKALDGITPVKWAQPCREKKVNTSNMYQVEGLTGFPM